MKSNYQIFLIVLSFFSGLFTYLIINDYIYSLIVLFLSLLLSLKAIKIYNQNKKVYQSLEDIYSFTNLLNLQMYSSKNLTEGYLNIQQYLSHEYQNINSEDLIEYLEQKANENDFTSFKLYVKSMKLYESEGGDFNKLTKNFYKNISDSKNYYNKLKTEKTIKLFDISLLYCLLILIIVFLKFSLGDLFIKMMENNIYKFTFMGCIAFGFCSYIMCLCDYNTNKIKGL